VVGRPRDGWKIRGNGQRISDAEARTVRPEVRFGEGERGCDVMNGEVGEDFVSWDDELWMPKGRKGKKPEEHDQHEIPSRSPLVNSSVPKTKNDSWSEIRLPVRNSLDDFLHQLEDLDIVVRLEVNLPHRNTHTPVNILRGQAA
jgi:hypothetical protein